MAAKKLGKKIEGTEVLFSLGKEELRYDSATLPQEMKDRLIVSGLGHKLGDSAAGAKTPEESKTNIERVWTNLMAGEWKTAREASEESKTPKISQKTILENLEKLPPEQQEAAKVLLAAMGFAIL